MKKWIGVVALVGATSAWAVTDYRCTIERTVSAVESESHSKYSQMYIGKQFTVERQSGRMAGALKNSYVTDPQVIDYGSAEESFKAVTTMRKDQGAGAGSNIYALTISEYQEGAKKPFIFLENGDAYLGNCEHF
jgi:hypothetical protein